MAAIKRTRESQCQIYLFWCCANKDWRTILEYIKEDRYEGGEKP